MIKIQYEFTTGDDKKVRDLIDHAKWRQVVEKMAAYLLEQSISDSIPPDAQMLYHRLRENLISLTKREGLNL